MHPFSPGNIAYLKLGNQRQQHCFELLTTLNIFPILSPYSPVLTGTIPLDIDLPNSDLDIICELTNHASFQEYLNKHFQQYPSFLIKQKTVAGLLSTICRFRFQGELIELFGQVLPTDQQMAYRHLLQEYRVLQLKPIAFRQHIRSLKNEGLSTEAAFCRALGLVEENPYLSLLQLEKLDQEELKAFIA